MAYNQISKIKYEKGFYILTINGNTYTLDEFYYEDLLAYVGKVLEVSEMLTLIAFASSCKTLKIHKDLLKRFGMFYHLYLLNH